jgi:hypothetical protein
MAMSQTIDKMDQKLMTPAEMQWTPGPAILPAGIQGAVLCMRNGPRPEPQLKATRLVRGR